MTRMFKVLPEIDTEFQRPFYYVLILMAIQMVISLFSYRSLLRTVVFIYSTYACMLHKDKVRKFIKKQMKMFKPVLAPYQSGSDVGSTDDEGYEEDGEDKSIGEEKTGDSELRQRTVTTF